MKNMKAIFAGLTGLGFFLPWLDVFFFSVSGFQLATVGVVSGDISGNRFVLSILLWLIPISVVLFFVNFVKNLGKRFFELFVGISPLFVFLWLLISSSGEVFSFMSYGLILTLVGGIGSLVLFFKEK